MVLGQIGMRLDGRGSKRRRHFKVFLRHRENLGFLMSAMQDILGPTDTWSAVEADICRANLEVEIELSVFPGR
jgi:hypothetical protein